MTVSLRWVPALAAGLAISGGIAAATSAEPTAIDGCVGATGHVRVITSGSCLSGESALTWNRPGPTGPAGPQGEPGPPGPFGPPGSGPSLRTIKSDDTFTVSGQDTAEIIPGSQFTANLPDGALIAYGGYGHSTLSASDCDNVIGSVALVDTDRDDRPISIIDVAEGAGAPGPPGPLAVVLRRAGVLAGATPQTRDDTTPTDDAEGDYSWYFDPVDHLGAFHATPSGQRHFALRLSVWGENYDGTSCSATYTTEKRRVLLSVFPVTQISGSSASN